MRKSHVLGLWSALSLLGFACGKVEEDEPAIDASRAVDQGDDASSDGATTDARGADAIADTGPDVTTPCLPDGGGCTVPPTSTCESLTAMASYGDPSCIAGKCVWKKTVTPCGIQSQCVNGGCTPPTTK